MHPPTEQLIRDYLNSLSVAARNRLGPAERQHLLYRTRARIEASVGGMSGATALKVRRALADLGDPFALVEREWARYAGGPDGPPVLVPAPRRGEAARQALTASVPTGGAVVTASSGMRTGSGAGGSPERRNDQQPPGSARSADGGQSAHGEVPPAAQGGPSAGSGPSGSSGSRSSRSSGISPTGHVPGPPLPREVPQEERIGDAVPDRAGAQEGIDDPESFYLRVGRFRRAADVASGGLAATARGLATQVFRVGHSLLALAVRDKLETLAILLLGLGGAVYPPVWVLGAIFALISPKWSLRDKVLGLVLPALLVLFGAVMVVALGPRVGMAQYGLEGWLAAGRLARVGAVIGAGYLLRRVYRGPRPPKPPPWSRPRGSR